MSFFRFPTLRGCCWLLAAWVSAAAAETHYPVIPGLDQVRSLDVVAEAGKLHAVLAGRFAQGEALAYVRSGDDGKTWGTPVMLDGEGVQSRRGNDVRLAVRGQTVVAVWQGRGEFPGSGPLRVASSRDGGRTWHPGENPALGDSQHNQGYPSLVIDPSGQVHLIWLDDREEHGNTQGLRYARSRDGGRHWLPETTLDPEVCTCCWNRLVVLADGAVAALYRDTEPHDMRLALWRKGRWQVAGTVGAFDWHFAGCPHCGGGLAGVGKRLHSVVWTGREAAPGLFYLGSNDAGKTWSSPFRLGGEDSREGDVAAGPTATVVVFNRGGAVHAMRSSDGGRVWSEPVALTRPDAHADHPKVLATATGFRVFWTETKPGGGKVWAWSGFPL